MIEKPPKVNYEVGTDAFHAIILSRLSNINIEKFNKIESEYLYWDKIKYKNKSINPEQYWSVVKLSRSLNKQIIQFGTYNFNFNITDYILRLLHYFDLHIGGNLGSNIGINDTDKNKYLISSIMEEAISSSQMEGANTTRKKAKEMIQKEVSYKHV